MTTWQEVANTLTVGQKRRFACDCGTDTPAIISKDTKGISFYCFRCGEKDWAKGAPMTPAEIIAAREARNELVEARVIPSRCIPLCHEDCPYEAFSWPLLGNLTPEDASDKYGFRYDPQTRRVCIPIENGFLARRVFADGGAKYYRSAGSEPFVAYTLTTYSRFKAPVVVVEDVMSAIRVNTAGYSSVALLGTSLGIVAAGHIGQWSNVICWTDMDEAGDKAYKTLKKKLALYPSKLLRIQTERDPKENWIAEIQTRVERVMHGT
ncbi:toprim domain-containing protein [uncultured Paraglaciecola sp.]|uniref:toprim domain-containing protein n=1 Tax=uncultured Paraglaciecola sp. TaxID=1765024 RepID=UPI002614A04A|nr:toprim domain-containing protein [uncultured Paraglaciecola sp.]